MWYIPPILEKYPFCNFCQQDEKLGVSICMVLEWTAVKNELPKDMEDVLLFDQEEGEYIGYYYESKKSFIRYIDGFRLKHVTHWMHLPGHPEDHQPTFQQQTLAPLMRQIDRQTNYILLWPSSLASRIHLQLAEHLF